MSESEVGTIVRIIDESFRDISPPASSDPIIGQHPEAEQFLRLISDKNWMDFLHILETDDNGRTYGQMFFFMTPQAYHYFAPALLIFSMNAKADFLAPAFLGSLLPSGSKYRQEAIMERLNLFTEEQKHAIALVVDYYYRRYGTTLQEDEELVAYWAPWLNGSL